MNKFKSYQSFHRKPHSPKINQDPYNFARLSVVFISVTPLYTNLNSSTEQS